MKRQLFAALGHGNTLKFGAMKNHNHKQRFKMVHIRTSLINNASGIMDIEMLIMVLCNTVLAVYKTESASNFRETHNYTVGQCA